MKWCTINKNYIDFLKTIDSRIPNVDYGKDAFKPFFSPLFESNGLVYVSQVTSPKPRHYKTKAEKLYKLSENNPTHNVIKRCLNFKTLEEKYLEFYKEK